MGCKACQGYLDTPHTEHDMEKGNYIDILVFSKIILETVEYFASSEDVPYGMQLSPW